MGKIEKMVLAELAAMEKKGTSAGNKAKFLAMKEDIEILLLRRNIPVISVWRVLSEKKHVSYSYETFNRYCKMYIFNKTTDPNKTKETSPHALATIKNTRNEPIITGGNSKTTGGFVFNNNPNNKDLF